MRKIEKIKHGIKTLDTDPLAVRQIIDEILETQDKINEIIEFVNKLDNNSLKFHED